jgi:SAM-dependent methyltransferase
MIQRSGSADQIKKMQFWEEVWERCRKKSHLKKTQHLNPEKWREFYDRVSSLWDEITGYSGSIDNAIAGFIFDNRLAFLGSSALDIGCGPGALSFALAGSGIAVTALDNSPGMINTLKETIRQEKLLGIKTLLMDWRQLPTEPKYDLAVAGFFPDAFSPEGLCRMESFTAGTCLLVSGENETLATASTLSEEQNMPPRPPIEWTPELHSKFDKVLLLIGTAG